MSVRMNSGSSSENTSIRAVLAIEKNGDEVAAVDWFLNAQPFYFHVCCWSTFESQGIHAQIRGSFDNSCAPSTPGPEIQSEEASKLRVYLSKKGQTEAPLEARQFRHN